jgi:hypothetical protein
MHGFVAGRSRSEAGRAIAPGLDAFDGGDRLPVAVQRRLNHAVSGRVMAASRAAEILEQLPAVLLPMLRRFRERLRDTRRNAPRFFLGERRRRFVEDCVEHTQQIPRPNGDRPVSMK